MTSVAHTDSGGTRRAVSLSALIGGVMALAGLLVGLGPLNDNSFLTHLATGRIILAHHSVPHHDPYSFSAAGHAWVVQSWLASVFYGLGNKVAGAHGVLAVVALTAALLGALVWSLTRPAVSLVSRLAVAALALGVGLDFWLERPLLFGLVALALFLLAAEGRLDPRWLIPVAWVWVNVHGSFPLGLVALGCMAIGARLDHRDASHEIAALKWAAIGTVIGVINPVGPQLLLFPVELLKRQDVLRHVIEWQAPTFTGLSERIFLVEVVVSVVALCRRPQWRFALPLAVFTAAALLGSRNVVIASIVLIPGLAEALKGIGTVDGSERRSVFNMAAAVIAAAFVLMFPIAYSHPTYQLGGYPVEAVTWAQAHGYVHEDAHIVAPDFVGNYLEARYGPRRMVFVDDRYDMYPTSVIDDYLILNRGGEGWDAALHRYHPEIVVWKTDTPLGQLVLGATDWHVIHRQPDGEWFVAVPTRTP